MDIRRFREDSLTLWICYCVFISNLQGIKIQMTSMQLYWCLLFKLIWPCLKNKRLVFQLHGLDNMSKLSKHLSYQYTYTMRFQNIVNTGIWEWFHKVSIDIFLTYISRNFIFDIVFQPCIISIWYSYIVRI